MSNAARWAAFALSGWVLGSCAAGPLSPTRAGQGPPPVEGRARRAAPPGFAGLADRLRPSVVHVSTRNPGVRARRGGLSTDLREFFDRMFENRDAAGPAETAAGERPSFGGGGGEGGTGTGFLIGARGEILTNHHVVEGAAEIRVRLYGGEWRQASLVGADPLTDLALLRIRSEKPLPGARLGDSAGARVGDWVLAIGNPFGLEETVTAGILSAKGRALEGAIFSGYLQTDAPIHRGNSAGTAFEPSGRGHRREHGRRLGRARDRLRHPHQSGEAPAPRPSRARPGPAGLDRRLDSGDGPGAGALFQPSTGGEERGGV